MGQREKRSRVGKPKKPTKQVIDICTECRQPGMTTTVCACGGTFCKHAILPHQKACIPYKIKHARLRRNALARQLAEYIQPLNPTDDGRVYTRLGLLAEAVILLLEAADRK